MTAESYIRRSHYKNSDVELFRELTRRLKDIGFFEPDPAAYLLRGAFVFLALCGAAALLAFFESLPARALAWLLAAEAIVTAGGIGHDAGHGAVTRNRLAMLLVGHVFMTLIGGSSFTRWNYNHRRHHAHPNRKGDPDLDVAPFVLSKMAQTNAQGFMSWIVRRQPWFFPVMMIGGGIYLRADSIRFTVRNLRRAWLDGVLLLLHGVLWIGVPILTLGATRAIVDYAAISAILGLHLGVIFLPNHAGMREFAADEKPSFLESQASTARNIRTSAFWDSFYNGLNFQLEHHLFPSVPFTRLRLGQALVRELCLKRGLPYHEVSLWIALRELFELHISIAQRSRADRDLGGLDRRKDAE